MLGRCGVRYVAMPHFPKTYTQGATFWMRPNGPVVLMGYRGRWADMFWFSLFHEIGHILLHGKKTFIDDQEGRGAESSRYETEADWFAAEALVPKRQLGSFVRRADFGQSAIESFARQVGVSQGIIVGRLQREGLIGRNSALNRLRERYVPAQMAK